MSTSEHILCSERGFDKGSVLLDCAADVDVVVVVVAFFFCRPPIGKDSDAGSQESESQHKAYRDVFGRPDLSAPLGEMS